MTRSVTVVNTSNWRGEDLVVLSNGRREELAPGESANYAVHKDGVFPVEFVGKGETGEPFYDEDSVDVEGNPRQVFPVVDVRWE